MKEVVRIIENELMRLGRIPRDTENSFHFEQLLLVLRGVRQYKHRIAQCYNDRIRSGEDTICVALSNIMDDTRRAHYNPAHPNFDPVHVATIINDFLNGDNTEYNQMRLI